MEGASGERDMHLSAADYRGVSCQSAAASHMASCQLSNPSVPFSASLWDYLKTTGQAEVDCKLSRVPYHLHAPK